MVANLPIAMGLSSGAIADAILQSRFFLQQPSPTVVGARRIVSRASAAAPHVPRLTAVPFSGPGRSAHSLSSVSSVSAFCVVL